MHVHFGMVNNKILRRLTANIPGVTLGVESLNSSRELNGFDLNYSAITPPPQAALLHSRFFVKYIKQLSVFEFVSRMERKR